MKKSELEYLRRLMRDWGEEEPGSHFYSSLWGMERRVFVLTEEAYASQRKRVEPLIGGFESGWTSTRKGEKVFFFIGTCTDITSRLDKMLSRFAAGRRRQYRLKSASGFHLPEHIVKLWEIQAGRCYFSNAVLGETFASASYQVDHLWPLAVRMSAGALGTNWPTNLALVTPRVNSMKGATSAENFILEVRRRKAFILRPTKERRLIDELRHDAFREFMEAHCSEDEEDWIGK